MFHFGVPGRSAGPKSARNVNKIRLFHRNT